jgi:hypothetical protein
MPVDILSVEEREVHNTCFKDRQADRLLLLVLCGFTFRITFGNALHLNKSMSRHLTVKD